MNLSNVGNLNFKIFRCEVCGFEYAGAWEPVGGDTRLGARLNLFDSF